MNKYDGYGDLKYILSNLLGRGIIQDYVDKGSVVWLLYENKPIIIYPPYGQRYNCILVGLKKGGGHIVNSSPSLSEALYRLNTKDLYEDSYDLLSEVDDSLFLQLEACDYYSYLRPL